MLRHDAPVVPAAPGVNLRLGGPVRWLTALVVLLAGILLGLAAVLAAPALTTSAGEATADELIAAWNDHDLDAIRGIYTEDAVVWTSASATAEASGMDEILNLVQYGGVTVERIGPVTERGHLYSWLAHVSNAYDVSGDDAVVVVVLESGLIVQHWVIWDTRA